MDSSPTDEQSAGRVPPRLDWSRRESALPPPAPLPPPVEHHPARRLPLLAASEASPSDPPNRLYHGDNLAVMSGLLPELSGGVNLIYIDPPFASGDDYVLRSGDTVTRAYSDRWSGGLTGYLDMLLPRLRLMHTLLAPDGAFYIHLDPTAAHYVKVLLDEIFGPECFQREIVWRIGWISGYKSAVRNWARNHDTILFYTKDPKAFTFHKEYVPHLPGYSRRGGGEGKGHPIEDVWNANAAEAALTGAESLDSIQIKSFSKEKTGYETQKNESILRRVIAASSNPGDLVGDFFCGSGTTLAACERLGRRWIGCDIGVPALEVTRQRLLSLEEHAAFEVVVLGGAVAPAPVPAAPAPVPTAPAPVPTAPAPVPVAPAPVPTAPAPVPVAPAPVPAAPAPVQGLPAAMAMAPVSVSLPLPLPAAPAPAPAAPQAGRAAAPPPAHPGPAAPGSGEEPVLDVPAPLWAQALPLLPAEPAGRPGRPRLPARQVLAALLHVRRRGGRWSGLPKGYGSPAVIRRRVREWEEGGVLARLEAAGLLHREDAAGGPTV